MNLKNYIFILLLFLLGIFTGCKAKKPEMQAIQTPERTAFYTIKLTRDTIKKITGFEISNVMIANSKINYEVDEDKTRELYFIRIEITDKKGKVVKTIIDHPLFKRLDIYSESGEIGSKLISLQKGQETFRVPYFDDYKTIVFTETINKINSKPIIIKNEK